jgi:hypothetical protein
MHPADLSAADRARPFACGGLTEKIIDRIKQSAVSLVRQSIPCQCVALN